MKGLKLTDMDLVDIEIPYIYLHQLKEGHKVKLQYLPIRGTDCVYVLNNDGTIGEEIEYGRRRSKYKYSLSGSTLYLPYSLDENKTVIIKCDRYAQAIVSKGGI